MKKLAMILMIVLGLSLVIAGGVLDSWMANNTLSKTQVDRIKLSSNVTEINVSISEIICSEEQCLAKVYQENVINSLWVRNKYYCSDMGIGNESLPECQTWTAYTSEENIQAVTDYVNERLGNYADAEVQRNTEKDIVSGEGRIS